MVTTTSTSANTTPDAFVEAFHDIFGAHAGRRPLHTRPLGDCIGHFTATPEAARLSRAAHFQGLPVPVTVRFSAESGNPDEGDVANDDKGMTVRFNLPDGDTTDIIARRTPIFQARTPETFLAFLRALRPDPATGQPDPSAVAALVAAHPDVRPFLAAHDALAPLASVAVGRYFAIHTFRLVNAQGVSQPGRYRWEPLAAPTAEAPVIAPGDRDYYARELRGRLATGPVTFRLAFQLPGAGDDLDDPTVAWPEERPRVTLGHLALTGFVEGVPNLVEAVVHNPTNFTDGVAASADPILAVRQAIYARSFARRTIG